MKENSKYNEIFKTEKRIYITDISWNYLYIKFKHKFSIVVSILIRETTKANDFIYHVKLLLLQFLQDLIFKYQEIKINSSSSLDISI